MQWGKVLQQGRGEGQGAHWEHLHSELAGPELGNLLSSTVRGDSGAFTHSFV